tara:strand:+ start:3196 stop:3441 length:246 start_codon:yes stop_codon:yes gene_type:complete
MDKPTIPILIVNITMRFPTKNPKKFTFRTFENQVTKGKTPETAFNFLRLNSKKNGTIDKTKCDIYSIQVLKVIGKTSVLNN